MTENPTVLKTQICIVGAGPGGVAAALQLAKMGIECILIEKAKFPRDKICGDGLTGRTINVLNKINPEIINQFKKESIRVNSWGLRVMLDDNKMLEVPLRKGYDPTDDSKLECLISRRVDFDNYLFEWTKKTPYAEKIKSFQETNIEKHEYVDGVWKSATKDGNFVVESKLLIVANGPNSPFVRHTLGIKVDDQHYAAAVRGYYKNVTGCHKDNFLEVFFLKDLVPGYFWIFPLPDGSANVGMGLLSAHASKNKVNLRKKLEEIVTTFPSIKERFANATLEDKIIGFPLPLGSKRQKLSGDGYMLVGDAGSLVDPMTGEGIGHALYSGWIAAEQAAKCLEENNFSTDFLKAYDARVWRVLGTELRVSTLIQRMGAKMPRFFLAFLRKTVTNLHLAEVVFAMFLNMNLKAKLLNPIFLMKLIFNKK